MNFFATTLYSLKNIDRFKNLKSLNVSRTLITDKDIKYLSELIGLTRLELNGNTISNISPLVNLVNLNKLGLACTSIKDLLPLKNMKKLKILDVYQTPVNNNSLSEIMNLNVNDLDTRLTQVS